MHVNINRFVIYISRRKSKKRKEYFPGNGIVNKCATFGLNCVKRDQLQIYGRRFIGDCYCACAKKFDKSTRFSSFPDRFPKKGAQRKMN